MHAPSRASRRAQKTLVGDLGVHVGHGVVEIARDLRAVTADPGQGDYLLGAIETLNQLLPH